MTIIKIDGIGDVLTEGQIPYWGDRTECVFKNRLTGKFYIKKVGNMTYEEKIDIMARKKSLLFRLTKQYIGVKV